MKIKVFLFLFITISLISFSASANAQIVHSIIKASVEKKVREDSKMIVSNQIIRDSKINRTKSTKEFAANDDIFVAIVFPVELTKVKCKTSYGDIGFFIKTHGSSIEHWLETYHYQEVGDPNSRIVKVYLTKKNSKLGNSWERAVSKLQNGKNKIKLVAYLSNLVSKQVLIDEVEIIYNK